MAKIKLGNRPKNFLKTVKFTMLDGTEGKIECQFTYRTRTEFGVFVDTIMESSGIKRAPDEDLKFSLERLMETTVETNTDYLMQVMEGWNLDEEFTRANVKQLCDEIPGASTAIMDFYRAAVSEGRLGN